MEEKYTDNVKTSLGPLGLDRLLMDDTIGGVTITNDAASILRMLGVEQPTTDMLVDSIIRQETIATDAATIRRMSRVEHPTTDVFDIIRNPMTVVCQAASNNVKTSLGPVGLDRMLMDDTIGDVTITNDAASILRMLGVEQPTTDMLVDCIIRQETIATDAATIRRMSRVEHPTTDVFDIIRNPMTVVCQAASNNVKTSLGPVGLDRLLMDDTIGDVTITNDAASILRMLGIQQPAQLPKNKQQRRRRRGKVYKNWKLKSRRRFT